MLKPVARRGEVVPGAVTAFHSANPTTASAKTR